ncbi:MAG: ferritin-like domain-containing protein [Acidobacteriota bacterium]|nr:ferritin-like domain-containing protein [Acidobacteriota bacterium]
MNTSEIENNPSSRRGFLEKTLLSAGSLAAVGGIMAVGASNADAQNAPTDLEILNYALTLEHLEATFYRQGLDQFGDGDFIGGNYTNNFTLDPSQGLALGVHDFFRAIRDHERTHVDTLVQVIRSLGGTPVGPRRYNFGYSNVDQFIAVAQALENTGVMAYDGAIALIRADALKTAAATIATVEARHASFLNLLNGSSPFPAPFDTPKSMAQILAIAGQFIVG